MNAIIHKARNFELKLWHCIAAGWLTGVCVFATAWYNLMYYAAQNAVIDIICK